MRVNTDLICLVAIFLQTYGIVNGYPDPEGCTGDCVLHDPSVIRRTSDGLYFRFSTHDSIAIATSRSLHGPWKNVGSVLNGKSIIDHVGNDDPWAPDVSKIGDLYYCYYSVYDAPHQAVTGLATSSTMDPGTWTDHGEVFRSTIDDNYNAIDPNLIQLSDGSLYIVFGSYWNDLHVYEMETPYKTKGSPIQVSYNATDPHAEEGPFIYQNDGYFYLFFSAGQCCGWNPMPAAGLEYRIAVCRAQSVTGPYYDAEGKACLESGGTTVLASHDKVFAPGGQGVMASSGGDILYYHYINTDNGYRDDMKPLGWNIIKWVDGWPTL